MDPLTLFALANGAVQAVKKGCQLYKDIKGAAGDVKSVLKDLDDQFHKAHPPDKPASVEARNQFIQEKNRVIELNKRGGETTGIYTELGNYLGDYFDNMNKCMAVLEEEERRSRTEIYTGDSSLGKRALQRVLMKRQLTDMTEELRRMMIYESPPELGALWTDVSEMMEQLGAEQKVLIMSQMARQARAEARRQKRLKQLRDEAYLGVSIVICIFAFWFAILLVVQDRIKKYPQYGTGWIPKTEEQRRREAEPQVYIGR